MPKQTIDYPRVSTSTGRELSVRRANLWDEVKDSEGKETFVLSGATITTMKREAIPFDGEVYLLDNGETFTKPTPEPIPRWIRSVA